MSGIEIDFDISGQHINITRGQLGMFQSEITEIRIYNLKFTSF